MMLMMYQRNSWVGGQGVEQRSSISLPLAEHLTDALQARSKRLAKANAKKLGTPTSDK